MKNSCPYMPARGMIITLKPEKIREVVNGLVVEESTRSFESAEVVAPHATIEGVGVGDSVIIPADAGQQIDNTYWVVDEEDLRAIKKKNLQTDPGPAS